MTDTVRCPACRGAKKVAKLGGMIGECSTCNGKGTILEANKPKPVIAKSLPMTDALIQATAQAVPTAIVEQPEPMIKVDPKKALYKRKKA